MSVVQGPRSRGAERDRASSKAGIAGHGRVHGRDHGRDHARVRAGHRRTCEAINGVFGSASTAGASAVLWVGPVDLAAFRGTDAVMTLIAFDESAESTLVASLTEQPWDVVVVGGGIREAGQLLPLFELIVKPDPPPCASGRHRVRHQWRGQRRGGTAVAPIPGGPIRP